MTSEKLCEQVLRIIAAGNLSFSFAENPEFVALLQQAYPACRPPTRRAVMEKLKQNVRIEMKNLKEDLSANDSKVSLALDNWSSSNNIAFMGSPLTLIIYL